VSKSPGSTTDSSPAGSVAAPVTGPAVEHWALIERAGTVALTRSFSFPDWSTALAFVVAVGAIADAQDHHPLVELSWGRVTLFCWTHDEGGVGPKDVALCTAINALASSSGSVSR
jgi:4a-hydroxytetrahydrobiopterin dehydratase